MGLLGFSFCPFHRDATTGCHYEFTMALFIAPERSSMKLISLATRTRLSTQILRFAQDYLVVTIII